jgi:uncharacterized protein (TIGR03067 family)
MIAFALSLMIVSQAPDSPAANANANAKGGDLVAVTAALEGSYRIVGAEQDGQAVPPERFKDHQVRITKETIVVVDADQKDIYTAKYRLNVEKKPYGLSMTTTGTPTGVDGTTATGALDHQGDTVKLIYASANGTPPTTLKTAPNSKQNLFILEKIKN